MPASFIRLGWVGAILAAALLLAAISSAERVEAGSTPTCTHGLSSIGPVSIRDGKAVGGDDAPHTETCLP